MNRKATRPIVLVLVFIGALILFSNFINKEDKDVTTTMKEASLPVMQFVYKTGEQMFGISLYYLFAYGMVSVLRYPRFCFI